MLARSRPAEPPVPPDVQPPFGRPILPGREPLALFSTLARDPPLLQRYLSGGLLEGGRLTPRQRTLVICRTTALHRAEYEWGIHLGRARARDSLTAAERRSLAAGEPDDACWSTSEAALLRLCDELFYWSAVSATTFETLRAGIGEQALLEVMLLTGFYTTVSYLANSLALPAEPGAARFPSAATAT
jgi:alkylhydroperoxidase family enzyme